MSDVTSPDGYYEGVIFFRETLDAPGRKAPWNPVAVDRGIVKIRAGMIWVYEHYNLKSPFLVIPISLFEREEFLKTRSKTNVKYGKTTIWMSQPIRLTHGVEKYTFKMPRDDFNHFKNILMNQKRAVLVSKENTPGRTWRSP